MKVWTLITGILCVVFGSAAAQNSFWGVTTMGGDNNTGVIFNASDDVSSYEVKKSAVPFIDAEFPNDYTRMTELTSTGEIYGVTELGGVNNIGTFFKYDPATKAYTKILDFDGSNGQQPRGGLIVASNGKIYGTTSISDADDTYTTGTKGAIFEYDPTTETFEVLYKFSSSSGGSTPYGTLCDGGDGILYGTTLGGGDNSKGAVFQLDISTKTVEILHSFSGSDGQNPYSGVTMVGDTLYGTTAYGGSGYGVVYQIDVSTTPETFTQIYSFDGTTMGCTYGDLILVNDTLYGVSTDYKNESGVDNEINNGTIFSYVPGALTIETVYTFDDETEGSRPLGALSSDGSNLIGILTLGGENSQGALFKYNLAEAVDSIFSFETDGMRSPNGSLLFTQDGKVIGLCEAGGTANKGGLYALSGDSITEEQAFGVHPNGYVKEGANPLGTLTRASDGLLYGNMSVGGENGGGTLFSYDPETGDYNVEYAFPVESRPNGKMILVDNRILVGMSAYGGDYNYGYVYTYNVYNDAFEIILHFNETNGKYPFGGLCNIGNGQLFGVTSKGGINGSDYGTIFKLTLSNSSNAYQSVYNFSENWGSYPYADLMYSDGYLYGSTSYMLISTYEYSGYVFGFAADQQNKVDHLSYFLGINGTPKSSYISIDGLLYGTTYGTSSGQGLIYSVDPDNLGSFAAPNEEHAFVGYATTDQGGGKPYGGLCLNDEGIAYGMTSTGGENNLGVIYEFDPSTATYASKVTFDGANGASPQDNTVLSQICNVDASVTYEKAANKLVADYYSITAEYQWYTQTAFDEIELVPGATAQEFMPPVNGVYLVEVTDNGCSNYSDYYMFYENGIVTTEEEIASQEKVNVEVYPNPGSDVIYFNASEEVQQISIYDVSGKVVIQINGNNKVQKNIDVKSIHEGVYFISFAFKNGNHQVVKFLKAGH